MKLRDFLQALCVTLLWALCYPLISYAVADAPPISIGAWRSMIAGLVLLLIARWQKRARPSMPVMGWLLLAGLGLATLGFTGMFMAGGRIAPGTATVLSNIQPLIAATIGAVVLGEKIGGSKGMALALGFGGIVAMAIPTLTGTGTGSTAAGVAFVVLGSLGVAIGNVVFKHIAGRVDAIVASGWALLLGAIPLWIISFAMGDAVPYRFSTSLILTVTVLSLLGTALSLVLWLDLLNRYDLLRVNVFSFMTTVFALLIGSFFFSEQWGLLEWFGIGLTLAAVIAIACVKERS